MSDPFRIYLSSDAGTTWAPTEHTGTLYFIVYAKAQELARGATWSRIKNEETGVWLAMFRDGLVTRSGDGSQAFRNPTL